MNAIPLQWYQHRDGGIYIVKHVGVRYSDRPTKGVLYAHMWPFEVGNWMRPEEEWTDDRFRPITHMEAEAIMKQDREAQRAAITASRTKRKGA